MDITKSFTVPQAGEFHVKAGERTPALSRRDVFALLILVVIFVLMLIFSWQRWSQPIIDHGREMNLPTRILAGDQLYSDVQFLYGPFTPYFNALLYRIFGVHLMTLHLSGAVCAILIIFMIYWLARQLMGVREAWLAAGLVLVLCATKSTGNYIQPYAYNANHGLVFALMALVSIILYLREDRAHWVFLAGGCAGLSLITKQEIAVASIAAAFVALILKSISRHKLHWRDALFFALPVVAITVTAYGLILNRVSWRMLLDENHVFFTNLTPQLKYFNGQVSGLLHWPKSFWYMLTGLGSFAFVVGLTALLGVLISWRRQHEWKWATRRALLVMLAGLVWWMAMWMVVHELFRVHPDASPLATAPIVLPVIIGTLTWRLWHSRGDLKKVPIAHQILLIIAVFGFVSIARIFLNVTGAGAYVAFLTPTLPIIYLYLLFHVLPAYLVPPGPIRVRASHAGMALLIIVGILVGRESLYRFRHFNTSEISSPRGSILTEPALAIPIAEAIKYARERTSPDESLLVLPQGSLINFFAERRNPLRYEIIHPGFLEGPNEVEARRRILSSQVPIILIANILTPEIRDASFGVDYNRDFFHWIQEHYHLSATFGPIPGGEARLGDKPFFILAYERNR
jgi:4-amino-4-deoxy-L-arabinose transferase-like glycosyltransferase